MQNQNTTSFVGHTGALTAFKLYVMAFGIRNFKDLWLNRRTVFKGTIIVALLYPKRTIKNDVTPLQ